MSDENKKSEVPLTTDPQTMEGRYANTIIVNWSPFEFTLDFAHQAPMVPAAKHQVRVVTSPQALKAMIQVMSNQLNNYEKVFGEVADTKKPDSEVIFRAEDPN